MTPAQQTALELLAGRQLTPPEAATIALLIAERRLQAIADVLSVGRTKRTEIEAWRAARFFIKRGKWRGLVNAAADAEHPARLAAQAAVDMASVAGMRIDLADPDPATVAMWQGLVQTGLVAASERDELQSWCLVPDPITDGQVAAALGV